jgi:hypothetical protein
MRVALFVTCLVDLFRPTIGFAAVKLLEEAGCTVEVPRAQTCCGGDRHAGASVFTRARQSCLRTGGYQIRSWDGRLRLGIKSNATAGPESWSTASVYLFLHVLDRLIAEAIRRCTSDELEVPYTGIRLPKNGIELFATRFLDCPLSAKPGETETFKPKIFEALVSPLVRNANYVKNGQKFPKEVPISTILFGPPGTSKTEIVEQIADFIGWPTVIVDPSYFVKTGLDQIQVEANRIFRMLSATEQLVVLFDEFDEMVRNRALSDELLSRFLTTAMLPKLARINKERRILFVVATNYIHSFGVAISRAGRFDLVLQMMPHWSARR